jgi:hypothetical protein
MRACDYTKWAEVKPVCGRRGPSAGTHTAPAFADGLLVGAYSTLAAGAAAHPPPPRTFLFKLRDAEDVEAVPEHRRPPVESANE